MFIKFVILCWLLPLLFFLIQKINFKPILKKFGASAAAPKSKDIWQHPFILAAGLKKEIEECQLLEVKEEEEPLCWKIAYNEKQTDFITTLIFEE